jgi:hypothetical protein
MLWRDDDAARNAPAAHDHPVPPQRAGASRRPLSNLPACQHAENRGAPQSFSDSARHLMNLWQHTEVRKNLARLRNPFGERSSEILVTHFERKVGHDLALFHVPHVPVCGVFTTRVTRARLD